MKQITLFLIFSCFSFICFANGIYEKMEIMIMKNNNVISAFVDGMNGDFGPPYYANVVLAENKVLHIVNFDKTLSGEWLGLEKIGEYEFVYGSYTIKTPDNEGYIHSYRMNAVKTEALSLVLKKDINNVNDIINNYEEIYALAETLAKESPEERTKRRKNGKIQDDPNFSSILGNFESDKCWGQVFVRKSSIESDYYPFKGEPEPMFADE